MNLFGVTEERQETQVETVVWEHEVHSRTRIPRRLILLLLAAAILVVTVVLIVRAHERAVEKRNSPRTFIVQRSVFAHTLRLQGIVEAVEFHGVTAPQMSGPGMGSLIVTKLIKSGTQVKKGDLLVEFDRQQQTRNALDREAEYRDLLQQIEKKRADQAATQAGNQTELVQAQHAVQAATLELRKNEVISQIDAEKNRENLEEAKAAYEQLKQTFELKRRASAAELRILEIQRDRALEGMRYSQANAARMSVRSPIDGIVVLNMVWKGGQMSEVKEGDEIRPGTPFMQVVNPQTMRVRTLVNQSDVIKLLVGQTAKVGLDAYPELTFNGTIGNISAQGETSMSDSVRKFAVLVPISGSDPRLMPDLSASVDVQIGNSNMGLTVPRDALLRDGDNYFVMVSKGSRSSKQAVKIKDMNDTEAVVESGLSAGDVVLRNPGATEMHP